VTVYAEFDNTATASSNCWPFGHAIFQDFALAFLRHARLSRQQSVRYTTVNVRHTFLATDLTSLLFIPQHDSTILMNPRCNIQFLHSFTFSA
jgi:hypothetical protein